MKSVSTKVYTPSGSSVGWGGYGPHKIILTFTDHKSLIFRLAAREIRARYKGSMIGAAWAFLIPAIMLTTYTYVFTVVFQAKWNQQVSNRTDFALALFAGLIVFNLFAESVGRAPSLLAENSSYITKVVFPLEALCWVPMLVSGFSAAVSTAILLIFYTVTNGIPPMTILWLPLIMCPLILFLLGFMLILVPLGLYLPDVRQVIPSILSILTFATPIFYPVSALPSAARSIVSLSPIAFTIEQFRRVLLEHSNPNFAGMLVFVLVGYLFAWLGYLFFFITKRGFADVI
jgi:lipopolysaccharide transport system permease protein